MVATPGCDIYHESNAFEIRGPVHIAALSENGTYNLGLVLSMGVVGLQYHRFSTVVCHFLCRFFPYRQQARRHSSAPRFPPFILGCSSAQTKCLAVERVGVPDAAHPVRGLHRLLV